MEELAKGLPPGDWTRCVLRDCTRGQLQVDIAHRRVWVWDGEEARPRCWHLIVRREVKSVKTKRAAMRNHPLGRGASIIGTVQAEPAGMVFLRTDIGGMRVLDMLVGDPLPRIC